MCHEEGKQIIVANLAMEILLPALKCKVVVEIENADWLIRTGEVILMYI